MHDALIQIISFAAALVFDVILIARLHTILCYILDHRNLPWLPHLQKDHRWWQVLSLLSSLWPHVALHYISMFPMTTSGDTLCLSGLPESHVSGYDPKPWKWPEILSHHLFENHIWLNVICRISLLSTYDVRVCYRFIFDDSVLNCSIYTPSFDYSVTSQSMSVSVWCLVMHADNV